MGLYEAARAQIDWSGDLDHVLDGSPLTKRKTRNPAITIDTRYHRLPIATCTNDPHRPHPPRAVTPAGAKTANAIKLAIALNCISAMVNLNPERVAGMMECTCAW